MKVEEKDLTEDIDSDSNAGKVFLKFVFSIILSGVLLVALYSLAGSVFGFEVQYDALIANLLYCIINVIAGAKIIQIGLRKKNAVFFTLIFGSLGVRIVIMIGYVLLGVLVMKFKPLGFVLSLFLFYFVFLVLEMMFLFKINKQRT